VCIKVFEEGNDVDKYRGFAILKLMGKLFYNIAADRQQSAREISSRVYWRKKTI